MNCQWCGKEIPEDADWDEHNTLRRIDECCSETITHCSDECEEKLRNSFF